MMRYKFCTLPCTAYAWHSRLYIHTTRSRAKIFKDYYDALGVHQMATQEQIKSAFFNLSKVCHPDKNTTAQAQERFQEISEAYRVIGNYKARKEYDRQLLLFNKDFDSLSIVATAPTALSKQLGIPVANVLKEHMYEKDEYDLLKEGRQSLEEPNSELPIYLKAFIIASLTCLLMAFLPIHKTKNRFE